jgi:hypothetical protein
MSTVRHKASSVQEKGAGSPEQRGRALWLPKRGPSNIQRHRKTGESADQVKEDQRRVSTIQQPRERVESAKQIRKELQLCVLRTRSEEEAERILYGHNPESKPPFGDEALIHY